MTNKYLIKYICIVLSLVLAISLLGGCSKKDVAENTSTESGQTEQDM